MAINNSVALGKTKGSIGNVTFARLKGQQISKSKIEAKGAILPANQSPAQIRMKNVVMAYQVIAMFLQFATGLRKSTESVFNAFVRIFKSSCSAVLSTSGWSALLELGGKAISSGNFIQANELTRTDPNITVRLITGGTAFLTNSYVAVMKVISATGANVSVQHLITEAEWNAGQIVIALVQAASDFSIIYAYNVPLKKCSEPVITTD